MPAAAAVPPRKIGGMAQNTLSSERCPSWHSVKLNTSIHTLSWNATASSRPDAATSAQTATCHFRSPVRSEWRPTRTMPARATTNGSAVSQPIDRPLSFEASRRMRGSHRNTP